MKILYYVIMLLVFLFFVPFIIVKGLSNNQLSLYLSKKSEIYGANDKKNINGKVMINVFNHRKNENVQMNLEDYIVGVVASEMSADFEQEALNAQAVSARTFAYGRIIKLYGDGAKHMGSDVCTDFAHCQAWIDKVDFVKNSGKENSQKNWTKFEKSVKDTSGLVILYQGKVANPLFHSNSGGYTEDAKAVWSGVDVPYLKSVVSLGEDLGENFNQSKIITVSEFLEKMNIKKTKATGKDIISSLKYVRNPTGRVDEFTVLDVKIKGTDLRKIFNLNSTNFNIEFVDEKIKITSKGYGHGVGLSQWGANYLALNGGSFSEIIKHYYSGVTISSIF